MKSYWVSTSQKITRAMIVPRSLDSRGESLGATGTLSTAGAGPWRLAGGMGGRAERGEGDGRNQRRLAPDERGGGGAAGPHRRRALTTPTPPPPRARRL